MAINREDIKLLFREAPRTAWLSTVVVLVAVAIWVGAVITQGWSAVLSLGLFVAVYAGIHFAMKWAARKDDIA